MKDGISGMKNSRFGWLVMCVLMIGLVGMAGCDSDDNNKELLSSVTQQGQPWLRRRPRRRLRRQSAP
jgi:hypothetical protein